MIARHVKRRLAAALSCAVGLGCASQAEAVADPRSPQQMTDADASSDPGVRAIRSDNPDLVGAVQAALSASGSVCGPLPEEPNIVACDVGRDGHVTLILLHQGPRLFFISHFKRVPEVDCPKAAPRLNDINAKFDNLTIVCADNLTFRASVTPGRAGMSDEELVALADQFRTEIAAILRAGMLAGTVAD